MLRSIEVKRNTNGFGYENNDFDFFHIPNQSKLVKIVSASLLGDDSQVHIVDDGVKAREKKLEDQDNDDVVDDGRLDKVLEWCQHYHLVGHQQFNCFDLIRQTTFQYGVENEWRFIENKYIFYVEALAIGICKPSYWNDLTIEFIHNNKHVFTIDGYKGFQ